METTAFVTLLCTVTASLFGEFSCEYFVAGVEYQIYHDNGSFSSDAAFESNSCYFINIFEAHVKLSDVCIASGIPASVLSTSLFFSVTAVCSLLPHLTLVNLPNICLF